MKRTIGWDQRPVLWFVRDNGPKLQMVSHNLLIAKGRKMACVQTLDYSIQS